MIPMLRAMLLPMLLPGALALADDRFVPVVPISPQPGSVLNVAPTAAAASVKAIDRGSIGARCRPTARAR